MAREPRARFLFSGYEGDPAPFWEMAERAGIDFRNDFKGTAGDGMEPGRDFNWIEVPDGRWFKKIEGCFENQ